MTDWIEPSNVEVPRSLRATIGGHPLVAAMLVRRGLDSSREAQAFLDPGHYQPTPPTELRDAVRAAERLESAIERREQICVWGDFDVDGQTSTTILVSALRDLGASVDFHIPNREREGHGIDLSTLRRVMARGMDVLLTCDTGITAQVPIAYATAHGVDVVITDHHDLPSSLPEAYAAIDPKMLAETHPLRELPGVGVAYKLVELLYERAGISDKSDRYLDLVALGIVADVATQTGDVRYLLQRGLDTLRTTARLGLQVLIEIAELDAEGLTEEHIGYELAPRLNALGRLADATPAVEFLTTRDLEQARILAHELDGLNARRKLLCDQVLEGAEAQIERNPSLLEAGALVLSHPSWPGGVIGIVAGRLAERYHRPTILISAPGALAHGSARSIPGCDISAAIASQGRILEGFGGHPMAAGLSIDRARIPEFRRALSRTVNDTCADALASEPAIEIDGYVPLADLSLDFVAQMERLAPFGPGNPAPVLATRGLSIKRHSTIGRTGAHLKVLVEDEEGGTQDVLWWRADLSELPQGPFDLAYAVRASDYRGQWDIQVEWINARSIDQPTAIDAPARPAIAVLDHRASTEPRRQLQHLQEEGDLIVWSEGPGDSPGVGRDRLVRARILAIWTAPPGGRELRAALKRVSPTIVHLFALKPGAGLNHARGFLKALNRLAQQAIAEQGGFVDFRALAAGTAQREETARTGLRWLAARGYVVIVEERPANIRLAPGEGPQSGGTSDLERQLRALLEETRAYRAHVGRADARTLVHQALSE